MWAFTRPACWHGPALAEWADEPTSSERARGFFPPCHFLRSKCFWLSLLHCRRLRGTAISHTAAARDKHMGVLKTSISAASPVTIPSISSPRGQIHACRKRSVYCASQHETVFFHLLLWCITAKPDGWRNVLAAGQQNAAFEEFGGGGAPKNKRESVKTQTC